MTKTYYTQAEKDLLIEILEMSVHTSELIIGLGFTAKSGQCENGLVIYSCAPKIISELSKKKDVSLSVQDGKVYVRIFEN